jgi:nucleoid-associated protein YgaU
MGLFSFISNAGKKLFGGKEEAPEAKEVKLSKVEALAKEVTDLGLQIEGLDISLAEQVVVRGTTDTNAERERILLALGNIDGVGCVEDQIEVRNPEPEATFYTVQSGDTLGKISKAQYGDAMRYNEIFEANKPMLAHPDKIYPGQVLRIP